MTGDIKSDEYQEVWSTWSITDPIAKYNCTTAHVVHQDAPTVNLRDEMRFRVQERRIERCPSQKQPRPFSATNASWRRTSAANHPGDEVIERPGKLLKLH